MYSKENEVILTPISDSSDEINEHGSLVIDNEELNRDVNKQDSRCEAPASTASCSSSYKEKNELLTTTDEEDEERNESCNSTYVKRINHLENVVESFRKENCYFKEQINRFLSTVEKLDPDMKVLFKQLIETNSYLNQSSPNSFQFYHESIEFEKKLVQVAEINGELVEFNNRLNRVILTKDAIIKRLKNELIELRGPSPELEQSDEEDEISVASEFDSTVPSVISNNLNRPLINIWIPTAFLASQQQKSSSSHHVYQIYVHIKDEEWNVYRRYSQFHALYKSLKKKFPGYHTICKEFPPKKTIGNRDARVVQERRKKLESYLRAAVNLLQLTKNIIDKTTLTNEMPFLDEKKSYPQSKAPSNQQNNTASPLDQCYTGY